MAFTKVIATLMLDGAYGVVLARTSNAERPATYEVVYGNQKTLWASLSAAKREYEECCDHAWECIGYPKE